MHYNSLNSAAMILKIDFKIMTLARIWMQNQVDDA